VLRWWVRWFLPFEIVVRYVAGILSSGSRVWENDDWKLTLERKYHGETCFCSPCQRGRRKTGLDDAT